MCRYTVRRQSVGTRAEAEEKGGRCVQVHCEQTARRYQALPTGPGRLNWLFCSKFWLFIGILPSWHSALRLDASALSIFRSSFIDSCLLSSSTRQGRKLKSKAKFESGSSYFSFKPETKRVQPGFNPGSTWGQPGVNLGSTWGQPGVNLGSTWGQAGVKLGSSWGQAGVKLGPTWGQYGVNMGSTWGQPAPPYHVRQVVAVLHALREQHQVVQTLRAGPGVLDSPTSVRSFRQLQRHSIWGSRFTKALILVSTECHVNCVVSTEYVACNAPGLACGICLR